MALLAPHRFVCNLFSWQSSLSRRLLFHFSHHEFASGGDHHSLLFLRFTSNTVSDEDTVTVFVGRSQGSKTASGENVILS